MTVWKFDIPLDDRFALKLPVGAELLHFGAQNGKLCLWARVDPSATEESVAFRLAGTGHPESDGEYVGTALLHRETLVVHLFRETP